MDTGRRYHTTVSMSPLFQLPREVRDIIWEELLYAKGDVINCKHPDPFHIRTQVYPSILRTCRAIYYEGTDMLYGINTFRYDNRGWISIETDTIFDCMPVVCFLQSVQLVIRLEYNSIPLHRNYSGSDFIDFVGFGQDMKSLEIAFVDTSSEAPVAPLCTDLNANFVQSVRNLENFKRIVIHLPSKRIHTELALYWSPRLTKELESRLGPNVSTVEHVLEFRPHNQPPSWMNEQNAPSYGASRQSSPFQKYSPWNSRRRVIDDRASLR